MPAPRRRPAGHAAHSALAGLFLACCVGFPFRLDASFATGGGGGGASQGGGGGSQGSGAQSPQSPVIPLDLKVVATCYSRRDPALISDRYKECQSFWVQSRQDFGTGAALDIPSLWTPMENCELSLAYSKEQWPDVQEIVKRFLCDLQCANAPGYQDVSTASDMTPCCKKGDKACQLLLKGEAHLPLGAYYSALFLNQAQAAPALTRVLFHQPSPEVYGNRVGAFKLYDLQLLPDLGILATSRYQATTAPNPLAAQLSSFLSQAAGGAKSVAAPPVALPLIPSPTRAGKATFADLADQLATHQDEMKGVKVELEAAKQLTFDLDKSVQQSATEKMKDLQARIDELSQEIKIVKAKMAAIPRLAIRQVDLPRAFKAVGFNVTSVVPQATPTDQLAFTLPLQSYLLAAFQERAVQEDTTAFGVWHCPEGQKCTQTPSTDPGPVATFNRQLEDRYLKCQPPPSPPTLTLTAPPVAGGKATVTMRQTDASGQVLQTAGKIAAFEWQRIDVPPDPNQIYSCALASPARNEWTATCGLGTTKGLLAIRGVVASAGDPALPDPPRLCTGTPPSALPAATSVLVPSPIANLDATLLLSDARPAPGATLNAEYRLRWTAGTPQPLKIQIATFDPCGNALPAWEATLPPAASTSGTTQISTSSVAGDHTALLQVALQNAAWKPQSAVPFKIAAAGGTGSPGSANGQAPAAPSASCLQGATDNFNYVAGDLAGSQQLAMDLADFYTSYSTLIALASPNQQGGGQGSQSNAPPPTQYTLGKLTHWGFSLAVGGLVGAFLGTPAKTATVTPPKTATNPTPSPSNLFERNPPSPALIFAAVDYHPVAYNETTFSPTWQERLRVFGGFAINPNAGVVLGGGYGLWRGLSLETGAAFLLGDLLPANQRFSAPTQDAINTRRGLFGRFFFTLGYSLQ